MLRRGSAAVHALVLSQESSGLFHKAISQSGSIFSDWAFNYNPRIYMENLRRRLYMQYQSSQDLVNQLRHISSERLLRATSIFDKEAPQIFDRGFFVPSVETIDSPETRIITDTPQNIIRSGNINRVFYLMGFTSIEFIFAIPELVRFPAAIERFIQNPYNLIPDEWNVPPNSPQAIEIIAAFTNLYFGGRINSTTDFAWRFANYVSDRLIIFGVSKASRLHSLLQTVCYYRFSYSGAFNYYKRLSRLMECPCLYFNLEVKKITVKVYCRCCSWRRSFLSKAFYQIRNSHSSFTRPFDKFEMAKDNTKCTRIGCMDLGHFMLQQNDPFADRMNLWHAFDQRFGQ